MSSNKKNFSEINDNSQLFKHFKNSEYRSLKHTNYFYVYDNLFKNFINKNKIFVEVGVSNGGSLFMWKNFFGPNARVIGIDFNPTAKKWEKYGFEIYIGNQADPEFWKSFYEKVGKIDILVDDGGHTNAQQIQTLHNSYNNINDGGIIVMEDVHTSYFKEFGNPSAYSFINFSYNIVNKINNRFFDKRYNFNYQDRIHKVEFYESLVVFHIDFEKCKKSEPIDNNGKALNADDYRLMDIKIFSTVDKLKKLLRKIFSEKIYLSLKKYYSLFKYIIFILKKKKHKKFFK